MWQQNLSDFLGWAGTIMGFIFFILPSEIIMNLLNKKQDIKYVPYFLFINTAICGFLWTSYGFKLNLVQIYFTNIAGAIAGTTYIIK